MPRKGYSSCTAERSRGIVSPFSSVVSLRDSDTRSTTGSHKSCEQQLFQRPGSSPLARPLFCTQTLHVPVGPATGGGLAASFSLADKAVGSARTAGMSMDEVCAHPFSSFINAILIGDLQADKRIGLTFISFLSFFDSERKVS